MLESVNLCPSFEKYNFIYEIVGGGRGVEGGSWGEGELTMLNSLGFAINRHLQPPLSGPMHNYAQLINFKIILFLKYTVVLVKTK